MQMGNIVAHLNADSLAIGKWIRLEQSVLHLTLDIIARVLLVGPFKDSNYL